MRTLALQNPLEPITAEMLDDARWGFKDKTAKGLDVTGPLFFKHLPATGRAAMATLLNACDSAQAWPWQTLGQSTAILGKANGGKRTIAILDFFLCT